MTEKFKRSWELTKQSWSVLREEPRLLVLPVISAALSLATIISFFIPAVVLMSVFVQNQTGVANHSPKDTQVHPGFWALMFVVYFLTFGITTFFNAALIFCALAKFRGEPVSLRAGLAAAAGRWKQIIAWSLLNATVGVVLQMLKEKADWLGRLVLGFAGLAWTIMTFFSVPVLVVEGVGPVDAVKRSVELHKKIWGESLITQVGVGTALSLLGVLVLLASVGAGIVAAWLLGTIVPVFVGLAAGLLALVVVTLISTALKTILVAACYQLASTGAPPAAFAGSTLQGLFAPKHRA